MISIAEIIAWKFPDQGGMCTSNDIITKFPGGIPSQADQDLWRNEYIAKFGDVSIWEIDRKRRSNYPAIGEQLDLLWHAIDDGTLDKTSDFYTSLKATKDKYPKT